MQPFPKFLGLRSHFSFPRYSRGYSSFSFAWDSRGYIAISVFPDMVEVLQPFQFSPI